MRFVYALLVLSNLIQCSFAQTIEWQNTIGGNGIDQLYSIQQTSDGGYILAGYSNSNISGDKTENSIGLRDYWIIKTDVQGTIQWQNTIGGSGDDLLLSIRQTTDRGYILGGYSNSGISGDKSEDTIGSFDYWVVKTDSAGSIQWQNTIGGSGYDYLQSIEQTADGGYILGGSSSSDISGDKTEDSYGSTDFWIVKINAVGNIQWQHTIGGSREDGISSIHQTTDGGYILGGTSSSDSTGNKTEDRIGHIALDYWIVKIDSSGNIQWQNDIGGSDHDYLTSVQQTADDGYILGGYSASNISGDKTENLLDTSLTMFGTDYWIVKTDSAGNIQWQNTIGGSFWEQLQSVQQTTDGGYILGGYSASDISGDKTEARVGNVDYWIVKADSSGNIQWQNTIGGSDQDNLTSIEQTSDKGYILSGYSSSNRSGDKTENCHWIYYDYWIVKLNAKDNLISGKLFLDANGNGTHDPGDSLLPYKRVTETFTTRFAFSEPNGHFSIPVSDTGTFTVMPPMLNYYSTLPLSRAAYFSGMQQEDSLNDFAYQPSGVFNDLCVSLAPVGNFRGGRNAGYMLSFENIGTTTLNATVVFFPDSILSFLWSVPVPAAITTDSVVWNTGPLAPFQKGTILVTVSVNQNTPNGTIISSSTRIEPVAGDADTSCNYATWQVVTSGSYDPNEIIVDRNVLLNYELINPPFLEYIINFQNTGNDTAFDVKILNPIDTSSLQINTLELVASSHPVNMHFKPWEKNMEFSFANILLPDSNINEPGSHGFVHYHIRPKSNLQVGDTISNTAYIYFDFNSPVQTNTATTEIILPTSLDELAAPQLQFTVYPNPVTHTANVKFSNPKQDSFELTLLDLAGRQVETSTTTSGKIVIERRNKPAGVYLLRLTNGKTGEQAYGKIVIGN